MALTFALSKGLSHGLVHSLAGHDAAGVLTKEELLADAKGWYDTTPSTFKTDLVASFDSANSEHLHNDSFLVDLSGEFTLSAWVKVNTIGVNSWFLDYGAAGTTDIGVALYVNSSGALSFRFSDGATLRILPGYTMPAGVFVHVMVTRDALNNISVYYNGQVGATFTSAADLTPTSKLLCLGAVNKVAWYLPGEESHVAFWERALTAAERATLYNGGTMQAIPDELKPGGVSYWPLNEPRGTRYDRWWGGNHLTDNNTVGAAHGPVEYQAGEYAGVTKWENQGTDASPFADVVTPTAIKSPQLLNGLLTWDGVNSAGLHSATGTVSPDSAIYVVARADSDGPAGGGLVDSDNSTNRHLIYLVSNYLRVIASSGDRALTTNDGHDRFGLYAEYTTTSITAKVGGETFIDSSASPGDMIGLSIGGYHNQSATGAWDGTIEAVLVFDRVLTSAELASLESLYF